MSPWTETPDRFAQLARDRRRRRADVLESLASEIDGQLQEDLDAAQIIAEEILDTTHANDTHLTPR